MQRQWSLAAICGVFFVFMVGSVVVGVQPAVAQTLKPAADVRVVNTASQPVPVQVQGTASVSVANEVGISSLPAVQVGNDEEHAVPVSIGSLPAVQVGNDSSNPIPVKIDNLPGAQSAPEPVAIFGTVGIQDNAIAATDDIYTVPVGKRLKITFATCAISTEGPAPKHRFSMVTRLNGVDNFCTLFPDGRFQGAVFKTDSVSKEVLMYADAGTTVSCTVLREGTVSDTTRVLFATFSLIGELQDMPSAPMP